MEDLTKNMSDTMNKQISVEPLRKPVDPDMKKGKDPKKKKKRGTDAKISK